MQIDIITPEAVRRVLQAWQTGKLVVSELFDLYLLQDTPGSGGVLAGNREAPAGSREAPASRQAERLYDFLRASSEQQLLLCRQNSRATAQPQTPGLARLKADFLAEAPMLEAWSALYHRFFLDPPQPVDALEQAAGADARQLRRRVESGLTHLANLLRQAESQARRRARRAQAISRLPSNGDLHLFGVSGLVTQVQHWLSAADGPRLVSLEGMGGIGKTALAQAAVLESVQHLELEDVIWISARQEWLPGEDVPTEAPVHSLDEMVTRLTDLLGLQHAYGLATSDKLAALRQVLPQQPYLVILDNLETLQDARQIAPLMQPLSGATRFLLTSRHSLAGLAGVQCLPVPELSPADSQALLRHELGRSGRASTLSEDDLHAIYNDVGGLPLALKLLAAQIRHLPLARALQGLKQPQSRGSARLYRFLYRRAWQQLAAPAQQLIRAMLDISPEGEDMEWLQGLSGLEAEPFEAALAQLIDYSLVEVSGPAAAPLYRLHRITSTLLQTGFDDLPDEEPA